jgi:hypothetical protein
MKTLLLSIGVLFAAQSAQAQDFYHSLGLGYFGSVVQYAYSNSLEDVDATLVGSMPLATYKASLGFDISRKQTFALTAYPSLGGTLGRETRNFGFALPIAAEMYFGDIDDTHFKVALGATFARISYDSYYYTEVASVFGPSVGIGYQTEIKDQLIEINANYVYGLTSSPMIPDGATVTKDVNYGFSIQFLYSLTD